MAAPWVLSAACGSTGSATAVATGDVGVVGDAALAPDAGPMDAIATDAGAVVTDGGTRDEASAEATAPDVAPAVDAGPFGCSVTGTLFSTGFTVADCVFTSATMAVGVRSDLIITDFPGACAVVSAGDGRANSHVLDFRFTGRALMPGVLRVVTDPVDVQYAVFGAMCNSPAGESANAGTVTVTVADSTGIAGTFDLTLNSDHITGSFHAPTCVTQPTDGGSGRCR